MAIEFKAPFEIGDVVTNPQIVTAFKVGNMGGMRRSKTTNTLVIICDHTKGLYDDKWYGDVLYYTGMGKVGDQVLSGNQNGTLYNSNSNGVAVHLFEVLERTKYIYQGQVKLAEEPYQATQYDIEGKERKVWIFPIRSITAFATVEKELVDKNVKSKSEVLVQMAFDELKRKAIDHQTEKPANRMTVSRTYIRDPYIARYARVRANGKCQLCGQTAPFIDLHGDPYLESHHIIWLSRGGADTIDNTVGLCPNCHRKMHVLDLDADRKQLIAINQTPKKVIVKRIIN